MNEEQSEKLLEVLENISRSIESLSREKELIADKNIMKRRIESFEKMNTELKEYDYKYLEQIRNEEKFATGYGLLKKNFERGK